MSYSRFRRAKTTPRRPTVNPVGPCFVCFARSPVAVIDCDTTSVSTITGDVIESNPCETISRDLRFGSRLFWTLARVEWGTVHSVADMFSRLGAMNATRRAGGLRSPKVLVVPTPKIIHIQMFLKFNVKYVLSTVVALRQNKHFENYINFIAHVN